MSLLSLLQSCKHYHSTIDSHHHYSIDDSLQISRVDWHSIDIQQCICKFFFVGISQVIEISRNLIRPSSLCSFSIAKQINEFSFFWILKKSRERETERHVFIWSICLYNKPTHVFDKRKYGKYKSKFDLSLLFPTGSNQIAELSLSN